MEVRKVGSCPAPKERDIVYILRLMRKAKKKPEKFGKLAVNEFTRLNANSIITEEYELVLNGKSTLSTTERQEVRNWIDNLIDVKNENSAPAE